MYEERLASREHLAEKRLGLAARVDVRRVDEVDADLERLFHARLRLRALDAAAIGEPRAEADLRRRGGHYPRGGGTSLSYLAESRLGQDGGRHAARNPFEPARAVIGYKG